MRLDDPRRPSQDAIDAAVDSMPETFDNRNLREALGITAFDASEELSRQRIAGRIAHATGARRWRRAAR